MLHVQELPAPKIHENSIMHEPAVREVEIEPSMYIICSSCPSQRHLGGSVTSQYHYNHSGLHTLSEHGGMRYGLAMENDVEKDRVWPGSEKR